MTPRNRPRTITARAASRGDGRASAAAVTLLAALLFMLIGCSSEQVALTEQPTRRSASITLPSPTVPPPRSTSTSPSPLPTARTRPAATATIAATVPAELDGLPVVVQAELPSEARDTIALIKREGPFPYRQDGAVFQNRERLLLQRARGYYHEYTVETPGSPDRGARRIITGERGEYYYTEDHYDSFVRIWDP